MQVKINSNEQVTTQKQLQNPRASIVQAPINSNLLSPNLELGKESISGDPQRQQNASFGLLRNRENVGSGTNIHSSMNLLMTPPKNKQSGNMHGTSYQNKDLIIHRTSNSVIYNDNHDYLKRKEEREKNIRDKGWNAPTDKPYQQFGEFANVLTAIEGVKMNLPHTRGSLDIQTHKNIKAMKRINESGNNYSSSSSFAQQLVEPGRTVKILNQYQGQLRKLRAVNMTMLGQVATAPGSRGSGLFGKKRYSNQDHSRKRKHGLASGDDSRGGDEDEEEDEEQIMKEQHYVRLKNTRLHTSSLKRLIDQSDDGSDILKSEIAQSYQRVKAVKHGMMIKEIMQNAHLNRYRINYKTAVQTRRQSTDTPVESEGFKLEPIENESNTFITGLQEKASNINMSTTNKKFSQASTNSKTQPSSPNRSMYSKLKNLSSQRGIQNASRVSSQQQSELTDRKQLILSRLSNKTQIEINTYNKTNGITFSRQNHEPSQSFQPEPIIYIPHFNSKKAKVIRLSDLAKLSQGGGTITNKNSSLGEISAQLGLSSQVEKISSFQEAVNNTSSHQNFQNGGGSLLNNMNFKKQPGNVNYHRKLQDEFERYEQIFNSHASNQNQYLNKETPMNITSSETPRMGQIINQLISNQYINRSSQHASNPQTYLSAQSSYMIGVTPKRGLSRDGSQQSESISPMTKINGKMISVGAKPKKSSIVVKNFTNNNNEIGITPFPIPKSIKNTLTVQSNVLNKKTLSSSQGGATNTAYQNQNTGATARQPKNFEFRLSKQEREQILISAITNSIKYSNEQDENKLLEMLSEEQLFKECCQLLKDYFQVNFLNELKDNKVLMFRLYKLYLLHSLSMNFKQIDENQNQANQVTYFKRHQKQNQNGSVEEVVSMASDSSDDEQNYRGENGSGAFKQKMNGFIRLLQEILSPAEKESLELDSVFQLKSLVKSYYEKKGSMAESLTETLYAMMCERSSILNSKKRFFFQSYEDKDSQNSQQSSEHDVKKIRNLYFELEQMRLKAEKERLTNYREMIEQILFNAGGQGAAGASPMKKI